MPYRFNEPPQDPRGALPGPELAGIRPGAAAAGGLDGLGHARGDRGLVPAAHGSARSAAGLLGRGDRDRAPAAPGLWSALAADRRPAALARHPARLGYRRSHHTTFSRRSPGLTLARSLAQVQRTGPVHVVIDSTGLKVYGAGEWLTEKHGERGQRTWRKLHLAVDPNSGEILACELTTIEEGDAALVGPLLDQITSPIASVTADGAYDGDPVYRAVAERQPDPPAAVVIPPRASAVPSPTADTTPSQRDQHIRMIRDKGRLGWQKAVGYGRRSLGETAVFRYKTIIGRSLRARTLSSQKTEARVACSVLNRMTRLGMPVSQRIA